jgi:ribosome-associated toxin RatA of RatAB toxin-antitoxin module
LEQLGYSHTLGEYVMPLIKENYEIKSLPEQVFDLINDVENTSNYSSVQNIGPDLYQYTINVAGIPLTWVSKVTERLRPERISWESKGDISLTGPFTLMPSSIGTHVIFDMEYSIRNRILAFLLKPVLLSIIRNVASNSIESIKKRLETNF